MGLRWAKKASSRRVKQRRDAREGLLFRWDIFQAFQWAGREPRPVGSSGWFLASGFHARNARFTLLSAGNYFWPNRISDQTELLAEPNYWPNRNGCPGLVGGV